MLLPALEVLLSISLAINLMTLVVVSTNRSEKKQAKELALDMLFSRVSILENRANKADLKTRSKNGKQ